MGRFLGCGIWFLMTHVVLGAVCFAYCLHELTGNSVSILMDIVGGLVMGSLAVPLAFLLWVLNVHAPLIHGI